MKKTARSATRNKRKSTRHQYVKVRRYTDVRQRDTDEGFSRGTALADECASMKAAAGNWPSDMDIRVTSALESYGATRRTMYCPANAAFNSEATWNFASNFRILGYVAALTTTPQLPPDLKNFSLLPARYQNNPVPSASRRVLVADLTVSYNSNYTIIPIGGLPSTIVQRTSHLNGTFAAGRNAAMLDGQVEWADRSQFTVRFGGGASPAFEW